MSKRDWKLYLKDMVDAAENIELYIHRIKYEQFKNDKKTIDAVARNLEIIGEASKRIPAQVQQKHKIIPWADIASLRNIIAHEYFDLHLETVWSIIANDLPDLKKNLRKILKGSI
ncbi:MAG: DUF86 domain-containing protein [Planctomycetes bacterium]|nr:DUF86 domain-containing protein [Planctomycetota bacterium]